MSEEISPADNAVSRIGLDADQFEKAFPFHLVLDRSLTVVQAGPSLRRICPPGLLGAPVVDHFALVRPRAADLTPAIVQSSTVPFVVLEHRLSGLQLRGNFQDCPPGRHLFLGAPWLTDADDLERFGLQLRDFAGHDGSVDMLYVFQSNKNALNDIRQIAERLDVKSRELAASERELLEFNRNLEALVEQRTVEVRQALETLDAAPDGTLVFEAESLRIKFVSAGAVRQVGYDRRELLEMTVADLSTAHTAEALRQALAATGTAGHSILRSTFRRKTGDEFPVEMSLTSAKAERDTPDYIAVIRDITDRLRQEQRVQQAQRLEALGTVTAGIAHDMNNTLAPILMAAEILKKEHPSESGVIEILESSARRGATMVQTLLSVAKGKESVFVPLRLEATVEQVAAVVRVSFPGHIQLTVTTPRRLPRVKGDASQLHQLILNLCVNASDAMPEGGRLHLELSVEDVDLAYSGTSHGLATGRYVVLTVQDTGTGIPPEVVARIFEPFFTTKPPDRGTGLGLSSSMGIARAHGGLITVTSTPGAGSTFRLYLPASEEAAPEQPEENTVVPFRGAGQVILLVDDEAGVREMGVAVLTHLGFTPLTAANGTDGLKCLLQNRSRIAAVITDLNMPKMDGIAFARTVRKMTDKLPIAVMSGRMHEQAEHDLAAIQVTVRLTKPFSAGQLSTALRELLGLTA